MEALNEVLLFLLTPLRVVVLNQGILLPRGHLSKSRCSCHSWGGNATGIPWVEKGQRCHCMSYNKLAPHEENDLALNPNNAEAANPQELTAP